MRTQTGRLGDCFGLTYRPFCLPSRKEDVRPVRLVYGKHASRNRIPGDEREPRATANWNAWKHLRRPTALLAPAPAAAAVVPVQDVTTSAFEPANAHALVRHLSFRAAAVVHARQHTAERDAWAWRCDP